MHKLENYGIEQKKQRYDFRVESGLKYGDPGDFSRDQLRKFKSRLAASKSFFFRFKGEVVDKIFFDFWFFSLNFNNNPFFLHVGVFILVKPIFVFS